MFFQIMLVSSVRDGKQLRNYTTGVKAIRNGLSGPIFISLSRNHTTFQVAERKGCTEIDLASVTSGLDLDYLHSIRRK